MMTDRLMVITVVAYYLGIAAFSPALASNNIMTVLNANSDRFSLLVTAIQAAGLTDTLAKGDVQQIYPLHFIFDN